MSSPLSPIPSCPTHCTINRIQPQKNNNYNNCTLAKETATSTVRKTECCREGRSGERTGISLHHNTQSTRSASQPPAGGAKNMAATCSGSDGRQEGGWGTQSCIHSYTLPPNHRHTCLDQSNMAVRHCSPQKLRATYNSTTASFSIWDLMLQTTGHSAKLFNFDVSV